MALTSGDEGVVAILLGIWLLETAFGALLSRARSTSTRTTALALAAYAPALVATLLATRGAALLLPPGEIASWETVALAACLLLAPSCLLSGWVFGQLTRTVSTTQEGTISASAYWLDTLGGGAAGILLAIVVLDVLLPFRIAALASACAVAGAWALIGSRRWLWPVAGLAACAGLFVVPVDAATYRWQAPGQHILDIRSSAHGTLLVTERSGQRQVLQHRQPILVPSDRETAEQIAHLSAAMHPAPRRAILLGTPPGNFIEAVLAHGVENLTVVAGDPHSASVVRDVAPFASDHRVQVVGEDPRAWVRTTSTPSHAVSFDLVFVLVDTPSSVSRARLFSDAFYRQVAGILAPQGIVTVVLPGLAAYATERERSLHATVATTLRTSWKHLLPLPADPTLYLASASVLPDPSDAGTTIEASLRKRAIAAEFVTPAWIANRLSAVRIEQAARWGSGKQEPSTDTHPVVYRAALQTTAERLGGSETGALSVLIVSLFVLVAAWINPRTRPISFAVATTGFAGLALQLVLMIAYQTAVGALYRDVALVTGMYMMASCLGTMVAMRYAPSIRAVLSLEIVQLVLTVTIAASVGLIVEMSGGSARFGVGLGAALVGSATGAQFAVATRVPGVFRLGVGASVYAMDLLGAAMAALITVSLLVPWLGVTGAAWMVVAAKAISAAALLLRSHADNESQPWRFPLPTWLLAVMVVATISAGTEGKLMEWSVSVPFQLGVIAVLSLVVASVFRPTSWGELSVRAERRCKWLTDRIGVSPLRLWALAMLLPVAAMPLGRCYFTIPYLLCHACPRPCVFGMLRPYIVVSTVVANVGDLRFCQQSCPIGLAQVAAGKAGTQPLRKLGHFARWMRWAVVVFVGWLYFAGRDGPARDADGLVGWLFAHRYAPGVGTLVAVGLVLVLSFFLRRPFCEAACPIGAAGDALIRAERIVRSSRKEASQ